MTKALFLGQAYHDFVFPWGSALPVQSSAKQGEPPVGSCSSPKVLQTAGLLSQQKQELPASAASAAPSRHIAGEPAVERNVIAPQGNSENAGFVLCMCYVVIIAVRSDLVHPISACDYHR